AVAGSDVEEQEKIYETLNSKFDATALLGSSMPVRDPPSPPLQRPPPLPPRKMWQHEHPNSSDSEDSDCTDSFEEEDDEDNEDNGDDDGEEPAYKKYQQSLYMKQLSRGQREKELFQLALRKAYAHSFEAVNEVQENQESPSKNPSSSTTTIRSSDSDVSSKSTRSIKSRACRIM
ncbi:uncharacterized protein LOC117100046, partial [Anneissia japonica]|uniref:uncharacterized protein LOC117100046 n=1 Tax=Anneissia japonica TaxID=1529436 RepID=UPI0014256C14